VVRLELKDLIENKMTIQQNSFSERLLEFVKNEELQKEGEIYSQKFIKSDATLKEIQTHMQNHASILSKISRDAVNVQCVGEQLKTELTKTILGHERTLDDLLQRLQECSDSVAIVTDDVNSDRKNTNLMKVRQESLLQEVQQKIGHLEHQIISHESAMKLINDQVDQHSEEIHQATSDLIEMKSLGDDIFRGLSEKLDKLHSSYSNICKQSSVTTDNVASINHCISEFQVRLQTSRENIEVEIDASCKKHMETVLNAVSSAQRTEIENFKEILLSDFVTKEEFRRQSDKCVITDNKLERSYATQNSVEECVTNTIKQYHQDVLCQIAINRADFESLCNDIDAQVGCHSIKIDNVLKQLEETRADLSALQQRAVSLRHPINPFISDESIQNRSIEAWDSESYDLYSSTKQYENLMKCIEMSKKAIRELQLDININSVNVSSDETVGNGKNDNANECSDIENINDASWPHKINSTEYNIFRSQFIVADANLKNNLRKVKELESITQIQAEFPQVNSLHIKSNDENRFIAVSQR
jgi:hypothetical protein